MIRGRFKSGGRMMRLALLGSIAGSLAGCSTFVTSERVANVGPAPGDFSQAAVPTRVHGQIPGIASEKLAALYIGGQNRDIASLSTSRLIGSDVRVALYLNRSKLPDVTRLCDPSIPVVDGAQEGAATKVVAALCNGDTVVSRAEGSAMLAGLSSEELKLRLDRFRAELFTVTGFDEVNKGGSQ